MDQTKRGLTMLPAVQGEGKNRQSVILRTVDRCPFPMAWMWRRLQNRCGNTGPALLRQGNRKQFSDVPIRGNLMFLLLL